jgi:transposase, IS5 family
VTDAAVHEGKPFEQLLDEDNSSAGVYTDSAYRSEESRELLRSVRFCLMIRRKVGRQRRLTERGKEENRTGARIRCRIEHGVGLQGMRPGRLIVRAIGLAREEVKRGLRNLASNMYRYAMSVAIAA